MFLRKKRNNLIGFTVFTQSDIKLGVVSDVETDKNSGNLDRLYVKKTFFFFPIGKPLIINHSQIIEIIDRKIIVEDGVIKAAKEIYGIERA